MSDSATFVLTNLPRSIDKKIRQVARSRGLSVKVVVSTVLSSTVDFPLGIVVGMIELYFRSLVRRQEPPIRFALACNKLFKTLKEMPLSCDDVIVDSPSTTMHVQLPPAIHQAVADVAKEFGLKLGAAGTLLLMSGADKIDGVSARVTEDGTKTP